MPSEAYIAGVSMSRFCRSTEAPPDVWAQTAIADALADAGLAVGDIDAVFCGHVFQGRVAGQRIARQLGLTGRPFYNVENACASGATAVHLALQSLLSGQSSAVLAFGLEQLSALPKGVIPPDTRDIEGMLGRTNPATYALLAQAHMNHYGTSLEELAAVAVKARHNGSLNERAQLRSAVSIQEVLEAPLIAEPLTRLMCCPTGDGVAAAVLTRANVGLGVRVLASVVIGGFARRSGDDLSTHPVTRRAAEIAYSDANLSPADIDFAEVHDAFTIAEIVHVEDLKLCPTGEGGHLAQSGESAITGRLPINPSGGLLARGHPLGASGIAQIVEIVDQLSGRAGKRQIPNARVGLAHCEGGVLYGLDAGACAVHILAK